MNTKTTRKNIISPVAGIRALETQKFCSAVFSGKDMKSISFHRHKESPPPPKKPFLWKKKKKSKIWKEKKKKTVVSTATSKNAWQCLTFVFRSHGRVTLPVKTLPYIIFSLFSHHIPFFSEGSGLYKYNRTVLWSGSWRVNAVHCSARS